MLHCRSAESKPVLPGRRSRREIFSRMDFLQMLNKTQPVSRFEGKDWGPLEKSIPLKLNELASHQKAKKRGPQF